MTKRTLEQEYIASQLCIVAPFPLAEVELVKVKFQSERGETHWININAEQFKNVEEALLTQGFFYTLEVSQ